MSLPWGSHDNRLKRMTLYTIWLVGVLGLLTYLGYPDRLDGSELRSNKRGTDTGRRVGSCPERWFQSWRRGATNRHEKEDPCFAEATRGAADINSEAAISEEGR